MRRPGEPHNEYCRRRPEGNRTSICPPGVQDGSSPPSGSAKVNATTSGATSSRLVTTAVSLRCTGVTRAGDHRDTVANPSNTARTPHSNDPKRSWSRRPYRSAGLLDQMLSGTENRPYFCRMSKRANSRIAPGLMRRIA